MGANSVRRRMGYGAVLSVVLAVAAGRPVAAFAQDRTKASFRFEEGKRALAKGKLDEAITALAEAHAVLRTPASAIIYAEALNKKGRLVEALAVAIDGKSAAKTPKESFATMKARADLDALAQALEKRVPRLHVDGDPGAAVKIDGTQVAPDGGIVRVDPGSHAVETTKGGLMATAQVTVAEGEDKSVVSVAAAQSGDDKAARPPMVKVDPAAAPKDPETAPSKSQVGSERAGPSGAVVAALVGFTGFAFGAGLGAGGFLVSRARLDDLEAACPDGECAPYAASEYRDATVTRTVAFAAFGVAGAGLVTGIVGAVIAGQSGSHETAQKSQIRVNVGATSVLVEGSF